MTNNKSGHEKQNAFASLHDMQAHSYQTSMSEELRDQELERIFIDLGGTLKDLFADIDPETLFIDKPEQKDNPSLQATVSLLKVALADFIEDSKKISTIIEIYQQMNEKG